MKIHSNLGAVEHFGHQGPSLSNAERLFTRDPPCSLWTPAEAEKLGMVSGQDVHISQCSLDSNKFGLSRQAGRSKTTICQLKQTSQAQIPIPAMRKFLSPSSHPYHHLKNMAQIHKLFQAQGVSERWSCDSSLGSPKGQMRQHPPKQETCPVPFMGKNMTGRGKKKKKE